MPVEVCVSDVGPVLEGGDVIQVFLVVLSADVAVHVF